VAIITIILEEGGEFAEKKTKKLPAGKPKKKSFSSVRQSPRKTVVIRRRRQAGFRVCLSVCGNVVVFLIILQSSSEQERLSGNEFSVF
jgi:hypothetical protein